MRALLFIFILLPIGAQAWAQGGCFNKASSVAKDVSVEVRDGRRINKRCRGRFSCIARRTRQGHTLKLVYWEIPTAGSLAVARGSSGWNKSVAAGPPSVGWHQVALLLAQGVELTSLLYKQSEIRGDIDFHWKNQDEMLCRYKRACSRKTSHTRKECHRDFYRPTQELLIGGAWKTPFEPILLPIN